MQTLTFILAIIFVCNFSNAAPINYLKEFTKHLDARRPYESSDLTPSFLMQIENKNFLSDVEEDLSSIGEYDNEKIKNILNEYKKSDDQVTKEIDIKITFKNRPIKNEKERFLRLFKSRVSNEK